MEMIGVADEEDIVSDRRLDARVGIVPGAPNMLRKNLESLFGLHFEAADVFLVFRSSEIAD